MVVPVSKGNVRFPPIADIQSCVHELEMPRRFEVVVLASLLLSCGAKDKTATIRGITYHFPSSHDAFVGTTVVSVSPPNEPIRLHYSVVHYEPNTQGPDVPTITGINVNGLEADVFRVRGLIVICNPRLKKPAFHNTCGIQILDGDVRWAAYFDSDRVALAPEFKARAELVLARYREAVQQE